MQWLFGVGPGTDFESSVVNALAESGASTPIVGLVALVTLLWGASGTMASIRIAFRVIWDQERGPKYVRSKLRDFALVGLAGVLVIGAFALSVIVRVVVQTGSDLADALGWTGREASCRSSSKSRRPWSSCSPGCSRSTASCHRCPAASSAVAERTCSGRRLRSGGRGIRRVRRTLLEFQRDLRSYGRGFCVPPARCTCLQQSSSLEPRRRSRASVSQSRDRAPTVVRLARKSIRQGNAASLLGETGLAGA